MAISVSVVKLPGLEQRFSLIEGDASVAKLLQLANIPVEANTVIEVDGQVSNTSRELTNGQNVSVSVKIKGALVRIAFLTVTVS
jgi:hypothetical protein